MAKAASQLMPLFLYDSAGAIVPCGAVLVGGPDMEYGHFFHWNTVNEVVVTLLVRHSYDATPHGLPGYDEDRYGAEDDPIRQFATTFGSVKFVEMRNSDEGRTCAECGHVNDVFPAELWGWERQVYQTRAVSAAYHRLVEAGS